MKKVLCVLLTIFLLAGFALPFASAAPEGKEQPKQSIAIVFDNSGSMYISNRTAWCRATYAMEVFASMMNEGDTMAIYPMWPVEVDGKTYDQTKPVVISGPKDAEKIRNMYTPDPLGTPIEAIDAAYEGLKKMDGQRWLIVLTDGDVFYENGAQLGSATVPKLTERLSKYKDSVNVLYLGIGDQAVMPDLQKSQTYYGDKAGDSAQVLSKLTYMCNMIFGRDTMELPGNNVNISDLSMKKMIVFVQGKNVSNVSVTDANGNPIGRKTDEHRTKYSELGGGSASTANQGNTADTSLQGMVVTYENCRAGEYHLSCDGDVSQAIAYYEPDVDLVVQFVDQTRGEVVSPDSDLYAGEYALTFGLKDNQTGELTSSELLGSTRYEVTYWLNGKEEHASSTEKQGAQSISLKAGDELTASISADYLSGYHLEKSSDELGFPEPALTILPRPFDPEDFTLTLSGGQSEYPLSQLEELGHYTLSATFKGNPIKAGTGPNSFEPRLEIKGGNVIAEVGAPNDDGSVDISLKYNGSALETDTGDFKLLYSITYTDENGEKGTSGTQEQPFTVVNDGYGLRASLEASQTYYRVSELEQGKPLILHLSKDGAPLTDEELAAVQLEINADGLGYETEMLAGQSAYAIHLKNADGLKTGKHTIRAAATCTNVLGQSVRGEDSVKLEVQTYPLWLRWLIIGLILLLLALITFLILNHKVLPKTVMGNGDADFNIGGKQIEDRARISYKRSSKTLEINPPDASVYPYVSCAAKLALEPVSPRRVRSAKRQMRVTKVTANSDISSVEVGASVYEFDKETGAFVKEGNSPTLLSSNSVITVNGTAMNPAGRKKTAILSQQLRFK